MQHSFMKNSNSMINNVFNLILRRSQTSSRSNNFIFGINLKEESLRALFFFWKSGKKKKKKKEKLFVSADRFAATPAYTRETNCSAQALRQIDISRIGNEK